MSKFDALPNFDEEFNAKYTITKLIGTGAFAAVYLGEKASDKSIHAIKVLPKSKIKNPKTMDNEIAILSKVDHPNIIALEEIIDTKETLYLVMEYVSGGELFDKIVSKGTYSEREACAVIKNVLEAIEYLHSQNIAHRDLKPENLLLKDDKDDTHVMVSDFGLSRVLGEDSVAFTSCGTPYYVAPEVIEGAGYGREVDLWSIGVITYFLLAGFPPFMGDSLPSLVDLILTARVDFPIKYWSELSLLAVDFVKKLLVADPEERMTAKQALEHPWIKNPSGASNRSSLKLTTSSRSLRG